MASAPLSGPEAEASMDIVTQLQTRLDELATQLYAALRYTSTHHPSIAPSALAATVINPPSSSSSTAIPAAAGTDPSSSQANTATTHTQTQQSSNSGTVAASSQQQQQQQQPASPSHTPQPPATFEADLQELATDLVAKQVEIEELINGLPLDLDQARTAQEAKIKELAQRLEAMEGRAAEVERRREMVLGRVEGVIGMFGRRW